MKKNTIIGLFAAAALAVACSDLGEIQSRIDSLESRLTALETQEKALNTYVETISTLVKGSTVYSAEQKDGVWIVMLSDGSELTLQQGTVGRGTVPLVSLDADGYWMVDYGQGPEYLLYDNQKVKATGDNGITPVFGVDADGYWIVSYDGRTTFEKVMGADGNPVSALSGEGTYTDQFFDDVTLQDGVFTVTLKNGTTITLPMVSGFRIVISDAQNVQGFLPGETKNYSVIMEGVAQTVVTAPMDWTASLTETTLSITAPAETKVTLADTRTDVSVLAISNSGVAAVTKVKVVLGEAPDPIQPVAVVTPGDVTESTFSFTVELTDASSWKYLVQPASAVAPSASVVFSTGIEGDGTGATVTGLASETAYSVYVLPINGEVMGTLTKVNMTTLSPAPVTNDLYQAWEDGKDIVIAGVTYNKATYGEAQLVSAVEGETDLRSKIHRKESAILFLEQSEGAYFITGAIAEITGTVVIMSRYADSPVTFKPKLFIKQTSGRIVLKNLVCDLININGNNNAKYLFNNSSDSSFDKWHMEDCRFLNVSRGILYSNSGNQGYDSIVVKNCDFQLITTTNAQLFNLNNSTVLHLYKEMVFENNVIYNASTVPVQLLNYNYSTDQTGSPWDGTLSVKNNIFYNCPSTNSYFKFWQLASFKLQGNVFWADPENTSQSYMFLLYSPDQSAEALEISDNIVYGLANNRNWQLGAPSSTVRPGTNRIEKLDEDPFESFDTVSGVYTLKETYAAYGPQR